jgi:hypothetical protein
MKREKSEKHLDSFQDIHDFVGAKVLFIKIEFFYFKLVYFVFLNRFDVLM